MGAGWSSLVARKAHNLEVAGSNPAPATKIRTLLSVFFCLLKCASSYKIRARHGY